MNSSNRFLSSKKGFLLIAFIFCVNAQSLFAQTNLTQTGNIKTTKINGQNIDIATEAATIKLMVYSPSIIRVRMDKQVLRTDLSYAVVMQPIVTKVAITQNEEAITVITDSLKALITKKPYSITFYNNEGMVISEDEKGLTTSWIGDEATTYKKMQDGERFIGLGEKTGDLDRKGNGYTNWNTDAYGYQTNQDPIYATVPFYIGIHRNLNYGIFMDNMYQTDFNFGASNNRFSSFAARGGEMNYYFIYHKKVADIIKSYTALTGRMKMPPLWSLGYQQNRYSYYPDTEVLRIAQTLREKKIPADGITLDIHYMDKYQLFTWNKERFPNPKALTGKLKDMGFRTTVIVDPGIKVAAGAPAFDRGVQQDAFIKYVDGKYYAGQVWPGWCHFTDYTSTKGRNYWKSEMKFFSDNGVSGIWNDMNEIATWGQKIPSNVLFDFDGRKGTILEAHNVYGSLMAKTSYDGFRENAVNERPFILTRAGYSGMQRYSAIWTGDNRSEDSHMMAGVRLLNSLGLSGVPFTGMDIGGFTGNPSQALFARWMQLGSFIPYFRNHTAINTKSSEPWTYGEEVTEIARNYVSLRYKLMPYLYSSFYEATQNGLPINRSLAIDNTFDKNVYNVSFQNQFLFGQSMMVTPVESGKDFMKVYFPTGAWYDLYTDEMHKGNNEKIIELTLSKMPVFVKESSIIPTQSLVQSTAIAPTDTLVVHIYKGAVPNTFTYYEDDGKTFDYEKGMFYKRAISYNPTSKQIIFEKVEGSANSIFNNIAIVLHGFENINTMQVNGVNTTSQQTITSLLNPVSKFDPLGAEQSGEGSKTQTAVVKNINGRVVVRL
jgi:alpha-glucosidase